MSNKEPTKEVDAEVAAADAAEAAEGENGVGESRQRAVTAKDDDVDEKNDGGDGKDDDANDATKTDGNDERGAWDQTSRKVVVRNILKYVRNKEVKKIVSKWLDGRDDIEIVNWKKPPKDNWVKVTLAEEGMVDKFIGLINKGGEGGGAMINARGGKLLAHRVDDTGGDRGDDDRGDNRNNRKRKGRENDNDANGDRDGKKLRRDDKRPPVRILSTDEVRDAITPSWRSSYEEQLDGKAREMSMKCAAKICKEIKAKFRTLEKEARRGQRKGTIKQYDWLAQKNAIKIEPPLPSPKKYEYRNKCEFTVGYRLVAQKKAEKDAEKEECGDVDGGDKEDSAGVKAASGSKVEVKAEEKAEIKTKETIDGADGDKVKDEEMKEGEADAKVITDGSNIDANEASEGAVKDEDMNKGEVETKAEESTNESKTEDAKTDNNPAIDEEMKEGETEEKTTHGSNAEADTTTKEEEIEVETFEKVPAAGFLAQGWHGGVYPPHCLQNMPDWSCGLCDVLNDFFVGSSCPPYDTRVHRGVWRSVTLRASLRTRECMVVVLHAPAEGGVGASDDGSDDYSQVFEGEKARLAKMLTRGAIPTPKRDYPEDHNYGEHEKWSEEEKEKDGLKVTSVFFQEFAGVSHPGPDHPVQHVFGKDSLEERLGKCTFQISPGAFFQTNTEGAEVLYNIVVERIKEVTKDPKKTVLLDVCCGTGTIGLTCLKEGVAGELVGVDISEPAIADARINAEKNGFTEEDTTEFFASAAEKILPETMKGIPRESPIVAVVDPARDGLHPIVVRTLRANEKIRRLVYVSCNPTATLVRDAGMLCGPPTKKYSGRPFKPTISQPVDMFPSTRHCEMVMTFDRMSEEEFERHHGKGK